MIELTESDYRRITLLVSVKQATDKLSQLIQTFGKLIDQTLYFSYSADLSTTRRQLLSIKGIGPWTTEMIMMRCFGAADACPTSDLIVKRALDQNLVDEKPWKTNKSYMTHFIWNEFAEALSKKR